MKEYRDQYRGINAQYAETTANKLKIKQEPRSTDSQNRSYVLSRISTYIKNGMSQEEAIDLIMKDKEILVKFEYLTKRGLDLRVCFTNWSNNIKNTKEYKFVREDDNER